MRIEVVDCGEIHIDGKRVDRGCPFHVWEQTIAQVPARETCKLAQEIIHADDPERPEWCPLTKGEVSDPSGRGA
jgi:hypothetical protein